MMDLLRLEWRRWTRQITAPTLLLMQYLLFAIGLQRLLQAHLDAQAAQIRNLSFSDDVLTPLYGLLAALVVVGGALLAMPGQAQARAQHVWPWQQQAPRQHALLFTRWFTGVCWQALFLLPALLILALFRLATPIDIGQWMVASLGLMFLLFAVQAVVLLSAAFARQALTSALLACAFLTAWAALDYVHDGLGLFSQFHYFRDGIFHWGSVLYFAGVSLLALSACAGIWQRRFQRASLLTLLPAVSMLIAATQVHVQYDFSRQRNSLPEEMRQWLQHDARAAELVVVSADAERRQSYQFELQTLQNLQPTLQITAVHPSQLPQNVREQLPDNDGLLIRTQGRQDWLLLPQDLLLPGVVIRLQHLQQLADAWLVFLEGQGERRLFGDDTRDLKRFGERLRSLGYTLAPLHFGDTPMVPDNTRVLVLAHVAQELLPAEQQAVLDYVRNGGHLLWLRDPDDHRFGALEELLGVKKLDGTVFDFTGLKRGTPHPAIVIVDRYLPHASTAALHAMAALPWASALQTQPSNFQTSPLFFSDVQADLSLQGDDPSAAVSGHPQAWLMGVALQRELQGKQQRIIVVGDSNFASDTAIDNYGNAELALGLLRWLAFADAAPALPQMHAVDAILLPSPWLLWSLRYGLPFGLPLLLLTPLLWRIWQWRKR